MNSDIKFFAVGIIGGIITLFLPVIIWNVLFLDYINTHGKLVAWLLAPIFAAISAGIFVGFSYAKKRLVSPEENQPNPFWGWFVVALVIECVIAGLSNT